MMFPCFDIFWYVAIPFLIQRMIHVDSCELYITSCEFSEFQGDRATHRMGILVASGWNRSNVQFNLKSWIFADIQYKQIV